jgi:hypothetical protein
MAYGYIRYLAERLVLEVRRLLILPSPDVDGNEFIWDVALFSYQGHAARASGY